MPTMDLISQSQSDSSFFTDWLFFSHTLIALISGMSALLAPRLYYSFIEHAALTYYQPIPPRKLLDDILRVYGFSFSFCDTERLCLILYAIIR